MAGLPLQFPDLAVHLADESGTPIISSAAGGTAEAQQQNGGGSGSTTSLSQPRRSSRSSRSSSRPSRQHRAAALDKLTVTALRARDTAAHLGLGLTPGLDLDLGLGLGLGLGVDPQPSPLTMTPPAHMVVTYSSGAVMIESFLDSHTRQQQQHQSSANGQPFAQQEMLAPELQPRRGSDLTEFDGDGNNDNVTSGAPLLVGLVVAPGPQALRDARRATSRLERVGRALQQEWAAEEA